LSAKKLSSYLSTEQSRQSQLQHFTGNGEENWKEIEASARSAVRYLQLHAIEQAKAAAYCMPRADKMEN
jgi:hypothetical protein